MMDMVNFFGADEEDTKEKMLAAAKVLFPFYHIHDVFNGTYLDKRITYLDSKAFFPEDIEELKGWMEINPPVTDKAISEGFRQHQDETMRELGVGNTSPGRD
jgi:hypothetical protein